jgi:broad specificity phosphatase PhoE
VETDLGLRSWDVGKLEGKSMESHKLEIQDFKTHPSKVPVGGQSWGEFEQQAIDAMERFIRRAMEVSAPICIVTHGSFIQIFFQRYGDWDEHADYDHTPLDQAGVGALYLTRNGMETKILKGAKLDLDE